MARRFAKVSEEEIVAINETAFFYPPDLIKLIQKQLSPSGPVNINLDGLRLGIYPPLFTSPSGDSCILYNSQLLQAGRSTEKLLHVCYTCLFTKMISATDRCSSYNTGIKNEYTYDL